MAVAQALDDVEKLVIDIVKDYINSRPLTGTAKFGAFFNLIGDLETVIPEFSQIGSAFSQITLTDIPTMLGTLISSLTLSGKSLLLAQDILVVITAAEPLVMAIEKLVADAKTTTVASPAAS